MVNLQSSPSTMAKNITLSDLVMTDSLISNIITTNSSEISAHEDAMVNEESINRDDFSSYGHSGHSGYGGGHSSYGSDHSSYGGGHSGYGSDHSSYGGGHSGYGGGHSGYGGHGSYGGYGGGHRPYGNVKLNLGNAFKIRVPDVKFPNLGFNTMFGNLGFSDLMFRLAPKLRLSGFGGGLPDLFICPDILLAGLVVAFVGAVYAIYLAIVAKGKRRRRRRSQNNEAFLGHRIHELCTRFLLGSVLMASLDLMYIIIIVSYLLKIMQVCTKNTISK